MIQNLIAHYKDALYSLAEFSSGTLEFIGIIIIIIGSVYALMHLISSMLKKQQSHIVASLGRSLVLALEFKMGAEIIKTVTIHDLEELAILGVVIVIRALLAFIIHWEIRSEEKEKDLKSKNKTVEDL